MSKSSQVARVKVGDVFEIPIDENLSYIGQVISRYKAAWYVIVFDHAVPPGNADHVTAALRSPALLGGVTFDARFRPGMWTIVGNEPVDSTKYLPALTYGAQRPDGATLTNFEGTKERVATADEARRAPELTFFAPVLIERALKAHLGREPWLPDFDKLKLEGRLTSAEAFGEP